jgi:hypothetical protein
MSWVPVTDGGSHAPVPPEKHILDPRAWAPEDMRGAQWCSERAGTAAPGGSHIAGVAGVHSPSCWVRQGIQRPLAWPALPLGMAEAWAFLAALLHNSVAEPRVAEKGLDVARRGKLVTDWEVAGAELRAQCYRTGLATSPSQAAQQNTPLFLLCQNQGLA